MNGIEILSSETIYNTILPEWCGPIGFFLLFILVVPLAICLASEKHLLTLICGLLICGCITSMILTAVSNKNSIDYIEYKVTIDDSVSMNEFLDKYEIIEQEGKIYTVKERE